MKTLLLRIAKRIGAFQAWLLLTIFYLLLVLPFALFLKLFVDPLRSRRPTQTMWRRPRVTSQISLEALKRQS